MPSTVLHSLLTWPIECQDTLKRAQEWYHFLDQGLRFNILWLGSEEAGFGPTPRLTPHTGCAHTAGGVSASCLEQHGSGSGRGIVQFFVLPGTRCVWYRLRWEGVHTRQQMEPIALMPS